MRRNKGQIVRGLLLVAIFGTLICALLAVVQIVPAIRGGQEEPYREDWSVEMRDGLDVRVSLNSSSLILRPTDGNEARAYFEGKRGADQKGNAPEIQVFLDGSALVVRETDPNTGKLNLGPWGYGTLGGQLTLELPKESYGDISVDVFSGDIEIEGVEADSFSLFTSSGTLRATSLEARGNLHMETFSGNHSYRELEGRDCAIHSGSGDITLEQGDFDSLTIEAFSAKLSLRDIECDQELYVEGSTGRQEITGLSAKTARLHSFSGSIRLEEAALDTLAIDSSSGSVTAGLTKQADIDIGTFSGDVTLTLPEDGDFTYAIDTFSGKVEVGFPTTQRQGEHEGHYAQGGVVGSGKHTLNINTSSGHISIQPAGGAAAPVAPAAGDAPAAEAEGPAAVKGPAAEKGPAAHKGPAADKGPLAK